VQAAQARNRTGTLARHKITVGPDPGETGDHGYGRR